MLKKTLIDLAAAAVLACTASLAGAQSAPPPQAETCAACHGPGGRSVNPQMPVLAGQTARYLYLQLRDFQAERRSDPMMSPMAKDLTREEMQALSDYFAQQKPARQAFTPDPAKARLGKAKADETLCTMCHLGGFAGQNEIPRLAGQQFDYILKQLQDFKARRRTNDAGSMTSVSSTLDDAAIENLAHYIASL